jgi:2-C-methyl-D-erythritol 4-phosphate cytidylyltransferase/2-C-methyl-D-erythritol 2,4-cyclodiphosphate synthase
MPDPKPPIASADRTELRAGTGFDVHRYGEMRTLHLCGVAWTGWRGLVGHSDADVGLHALTDALFGTIAAADIGQHFAPGDPRWRGADSAAFLRHAAALVAMRGGAVDLVELRLHGAPTALTRSQPLAAMAARIAALLDLRRDRVRVAAARAAVGFCGRDEGIAAEAIASVRLPHGA